MNFIEILLMLFLAQALFVCLVTLISFPLSNKPLLLQISLLLLRICCIGLLALSLTSFIDKVKAAGLLRTDIELTVGSLLCVVLTSILLLLMSRLRSSKPISSMGQGKK